MVSVIILALVSTVLHNNTIKTSEGGAPLIFQCVQTENFFKHKHTVACILYEKLISMLKWLRLWFYLALMRLEIFFNVVLKGFLMMQKRGFGNE